MVQVQVSINVRPTQGYHYPNKIDHIQIDSFQRLEVIQEKFQTTGSTTRLYYGRHELPLNSSIGSHNFDDNAMIECCRSPEMSGKHKNENGSSEFTIYSVQYTVVYCIISL